MYRIDYRNKLRKKIVIFNWFIPVVCEYNVKYREI